MKNNNQKQLIIGAILLALIIIVFYVVTNGSASRSLSLKGETLDPSNDRQWSYIIGHLTGLELQQNLNRLPDASVVDRKALFAAINDVLDDNEAPFTNDEMATFFQERESLDRELLNAQAQENKEKADAFVAEYAQGSDVQKTENNSYYKILTEGEGEVVGENVANVNYVGKKIDGTVFDKSSDHSEGSVPFTSAQIIPGLGEALEQMRVGDKWEVLVPVETAYGPNVDPTGPIKPNEALIFEIEVVSIGAETPIEG